MAGPAATRINLRAVRSGFVGAFSAISCATSVTQALPHDTVLATTDAGVVRSYEGVAPGVVTLQAPPDRVMAALRAAYLELGIEVKVWDPPHGQVGNRNFNKMYRMAGAPMSDYIGCGLTTTGAAADNYRVTLSLVSEVKAVPEGSRVDTQLTARADDMASSKGAIACQSLGTLEAKVNDLANRHLRG
jgi:hypothetical protein